MLLPLLIGVHVLCNVVGASMHDVKQHDIDQIPNVTIQANKPVEDDLANMMQRYTAYNHWANQQLAEWLRKANDTDLDREIESSFSSIKKTVVHIWNAEYLWLQIVRDESADDSPGRNFNGGKDDLLDGWLQASANFSNYVKEMSTAELNARRPRTRGEGYTVISDMIQHCMNHSTYHRGQLITMGRQVGLKDPPRTDFIYYVSL